MTIPDLIAEIKAIPDSTPSADVHLLYSEASAAWSRCARHEQTVKRNQEAYEALVRIPPGTDVRILTQQYGYARVRNKVGVVTHIEPTPYQVVAHVTVKGAIPDRCRCRTHSACVAVGATEEHLVEA